MLAVSASQMGIGVSVSLTSIQLGQHLVNLDHHLVFTDTKMWLWREKQFFLAEWFQIWNLEVSWYDDAFSSRSSWPNWCSLSYWCARDLQKEERPHKAHQLQIFNKFLMWKENPQYPRLEAKGAERKYFCKAFLPIPSVRWRNCQKAGSSIWSISLMKVKDVDSTLNEEHDKDKGTLSKGSSWLMVSSTSGLVKRLATTWRIIPGLISIVK